MTSLAVTLKAIDAALFAKYSGISIDAGDPPAATPVSVFLEDPDPEEYPERVYPSVSIRFISLVPDYTGIVESDDIDESEEISYDDGVSPPVRTMRKKPLPHRIMYSIDTWHRARVSESRDLVAEAIQYLTDPRGYLTVQNIDGTNIDVWLFWAGGIATADERSTDEIIYHKSLTVSVLAYLARTAVGTTTEVKVATDLDFEVLSRHVYLDSNGDLQIDDSKNVKDVEFRITDTGVEVIP